MKTLANLIKITLFCFILCINSFIFSQVEEIIEDEAEVEVEKEVINLTKLASLMHSDEKEIIISDYEIISSNEDSDLLVDKVFFSLYQIPSKGASAKKIYFYNCKFNLAKEAPLVFTYWEIIRLNIIGCEFLSPVGFENYNHIGKYNFLIENCIFNKEARFSSQFYSSEGLTFRNNEFRANLFLDIKLEQLVIESCNFRAENKEFISRDNESTSYQLEFGDKYIDNIKLQSNTFDNKGISNIFSVNFESAEIGELSMISNRMQTLNLTGAEVQKSLLIDSLFVDNYIGILNFNFPEKNTNASWHNLSGEKFAIFYYNESGLVIPYQAKLDKQLADNLKYNDLISAYNKFNALYHDRGDITSANCSYVEIKDIETRKQAIIQKTDPSFNNLINYKLNVFLRFFSDYATNPGKSIMQSMWVLLFFTFLYMLSFSGWDGMNYRYYNKQFSLFSDYITSNNSIAEILAKEEHQQDKNNKEIKEFLDIYEKDGKQMPRILRLFGEPIHYLGKFRYKIIPNLIHFFNFQPNEWESLNIGKKIWSSILIIIIIFTYLLYIITVKFINSSILSLNSFVVIGFGNLPEKGLAMYLSIIEGIIGWFLLMIFTITLLSQVLQSA